MKFRSLHLWNVSPLKARQIQVTLAKRIRLTPLGRPIRVIAGADISVDSEAGRAWAGVIVYSFPDLLEIECQSADGPLPFPYIPGLLSFREAPILLKAFRKIHHTPGVILFDGQGIAHPRGVGLASHMGLFLNTPTIGCAKSWLFGDYKEPGRKAGDYSDLTTRAKNGRLQTIGAVLRTRDHVKPIFVSPGHMIDLRSSLEIVQKCLAGVRIPKPTREADHWVGQLRRGSINPWTLGSMS